MILKGIKGLKLNVTREDLSGWACCHGFESRQMPICAPMTTRQPLLRRSRRQRRHRGIT
ncbi:hypothetical protein ES288_A06G170000v1 [Gossypium darwinii]|uniref:Uncharacterized protein n=1 Tax=Gossypium darwinii TaxID=34276 RepID=A0A5D2G7G1_GOSDA|nr:hypothetical protein ES288_A06G170000v1 [Gossypium darwinii]